MQESIVFLVRVQCRRKESSRSLSHLMMSFLYVAAEGVDHPDCVAVPEYVRGKNYPCSIICSRVPG